MAYIGTMTRAHLTIQVVPHYLEDQSHPERSEYAFSYAVTVINTGDVAAQVIGRHWVITDAKDDDGHRLSTCVLMPADY